MQSLWMLLAALLFSVMGALAKLASSQHSAWELLGWRNAIGLAVLVPVIARSPGGLLRALATPHWPGHVVRNTVGVGSMTLWFASIGRLPLATSTTLNYTSSIFLGAMLFVGAAWRGERRGEWPLLAALLVGFGGILLVLRPSFDGATLPWALVALVSGFLAAIALMSIRALGRLGESPKVIVFYFSAAGCVAGLLGMVIGGAHWPPALELGELLGVGVSGVAAQLCLTRAYGYGHMMLAANLNYAGIVFAAGWGFLLWGDVLALDGWIGIALIVGAGVAATWRVARLSTPAPAPIENA